MTTEAGMTCSKWCWVISGLAGLLAAILLVLNAGFSIISAIIAGVVLAVILALLLPLVFCGDRRRSATTTAAAASAAVASGTIAAKTADLGADQSVGFAEKSVDFEASDSDATGVKFDASSDVMAGEDQNLAGDAANAAYSRIKADTNTPSVDLDDMTAELDAARSAAEQQAANADAARLAAERLNTKAPKQVAVGATHKEIATTQDREGDDVAEGASEGTRPTALDGPRGGEADDLKQIKGVGPKMEKLLNTLGFYHFDQMAAWTGDEVAWVDANLEGFKGRVSRDDWVSQAQILAAGGKTAFSQKVDKGGVY